MLESIRYSDCEAATCLSNWNIHNQKQSKAKKQSSRANSTHWCTVHTQHKRLQNYAGYPACPPVRAQQRCQHHTTSWDVQRLCTATHTKCWHMLDCRVHVDTHAKTSTQAPAPPRTHAGLASQQMPYFCVLIRRIGSPNYMPSAKWCATTHGDSGITYCIASRLLPGPATLLEAWQLTACAHPATADTMKRQHQHASMQNACTWHSRLQQATGQPYEPACPPTNVHARCLLLKLGVCQRDSRA